MSAIVKMEEAFNCLNNFIDNCNNKEYKRLIDIFLPMFYQENNHRSEISVGKWKSESDFSSLLSMTTKNFIVKCTYWNNEPQLVISDATYHYTIVAMNLKTIKNLYIESEEDKDINFYRYNIYFNYNDEVDYNIHIVKK